jgi:hypothetical protein
MDPRGRSSPTIEKRNKSSRVKGRPEGRSSPTSEYKEQGLWLRPNASSYKHCPKFRTALHAKRLPHSLTSEFFFYSLARPGGPDQTRISRKTLVAIKEFRKYPWPPPQGPTPQAAAEVHYQAEHRHTGTGPQLAVQHRLAHFRFSS